MIELKRISGVCLINLLNIKLQIDSNRTILHRRAVALLDGHLWLKFCRVASIRSPEKYESKIELVWGHQIHANLFIKTLCFT